LKLYSFESLGEVFVNIKPCLAPHVNFAFRSAVCVV
jgi:hypothetical protein